jgi:hypothetical protein
MEALLIPVVIVVITLGYACINWVFAPLDRAAKNRQCAAQFNLSDLLSLFILVQLPIGLLHWATSHERRPDGVFIADGILAAVAASVWWTCVMTLSRAGIHVVWQRCVILAVALPVALACSIGMIAVSWALMDLLSDGDDRLRDVSILLGEGILIGTVYVLGRFTRTIVASARKP